MRKQEPEETLPEETLLVRIDADGVVRFLWDDALAELARCGRADVQRASHVEPKPSGQWSADLSPVGGPTLGPFVLRGEALAAEREWLEENVLS